MAHRKSRKAAIQNLRARRDWGFAGDYVVGMHSMLQQSQPTDYVLGTGVSHSVSDFLNESIQVMSELGTGPQSIEEWVEINPLFLRTGEIHDLRADANLARKELGWVPAVDFKKLVGMMIESDYAIARRT